MSSEGRPGSRAADPDGPGGDAGPGQRGFASPSRHRRTTMGPSLLDVSCLTLICLTVLYLSSHLDTFSHPQTQTFHFNGIPQNANSTFFFLDDHVTVTQPSDFL